MLMKLTPGKGIAASKEGSLAYKTFLETVIGQLLIERILNKKKLSEKRYFFFLSKLNETMTLDVQCYKAFFGVIYYVEL